MNTGKTFIPPTSSKSALAAPFRIPCLPVEWLDSSSWRLPSGKALAEFALQAGFLAPLLFKTERLPQPAPRDKGVRGETARRQLTGDQR